MKKMQLIFLFAAVMALPSLTFGQGIGLGIKGGLNFANVDVKNIPGQSFDTKTGYHIGGVVIINLSEKWGIQPELLFSAQGTETPDSKSDFNYLSIPILLRWKPVDLLSIEAGPQFGILLSAEEDLVGDVKDAFKSNDSGVALGATVHLPLGLNVGARYYWGIGNILEDPDFFDLDSDAEVKNKMFQIYVGWTFLGQK